MSWNARCDAAGRWLFRRRGVLPLFILALATVALRTSPALSANASQDRHWEVFCLLLAFTGLAIRVLTVAHTPAGTSGRGTTEPQAAELNTTGMYSIVRHPLYLGNLVIWTGLLLYTREWWLVLFCLSVFLAYHELIMFAEETFLHGRFGAAFERWRERVPALVPDPRLWRPPALPFSLRNVLRREYNGFFFIIVSLWWLDQAAALMRGAHPRLDAFWSVLLAAGFAVWIVLRTLKRHTRVLNVPGR